MKRSSYSLSLQATQRAILVASLCLLAGLSLSAQQPAGAGTASAPQSQLPDSPEPKSDSIMDSSIEATSKVIGYMTRTSLFFPNIATSPGPLSTGKKFKLFVNESISPSVLLISGMSSAVAQARNVPPEWGQGWDAYGQRFGASVARGASNNFFGTFVIDSALHHDPRFFPTSNPTLWGSIKYATRSLFICRTDAGGEAVNYGNLVGPMLGEGLANAYLPPSQQTVGKFFSRYGTDIGWNIGGNILKNYWPVIFKSMGFNKIKVLPAPPKATIAPPPAATAPAKP